MLGRYANHRLGKLRPRLDSRTLKLAKYLGSGVSALPTPPVNAGYTSQVASWPMMLNDQEGDCTCAAAGHMIQQWTTYAAPPGIIPTDAQIQAAYSAVSGYVPGDPSTDNGAVMLDVLKYWKATGIGGHKILAYVSVDYRNQVEMEQAMLLFGNVYLGVQLPVSAQNPRTGENGNPMWEIPREGPTGDGAPGSWGGHAIPAVAWGVDSNGNAGIEVVSWGQLFDVTWGFLATYAEEAWVVLSNEWIEKTGLSPSQFNMAQLQADLAALA